MQFPDSTLASLETGVDEPLSFVSLLGIAVLLTLAAVGAGLLVGG